MLIKYPISAWVVPQIQCPICFEYSHVSCKIAKPTQILSSQAFSYIQYESPDVFCITLLVLSWLLFDMCHTIPWWHRSLCAEVMHVYIEHMSFPYQLPYQPRWQHASRIDRSYLIYMNIYTHKFICRHI